MSTPHSNLEHLAHTVKDKFGHVADHASQAALDAFHLQSATLLTSPDAHLASVGVTADFRDMVNKVCGPFAVLDGHHGNKDNCGDKAGAAQAAAARVISDAESGQPNEGAASSLNAFYSQLNPLLGEHFAAMGAIESATSIHLQRSQVMREAGRKGENGHSAAMNFANAEQYRASENTLKWIPRTRETEAA